MSGDLAVELRQAPGDAETASFCIGGVSVEIVGSRGDIDFTLVPSLEPFRGKVDSPDISVQLGWLPRLPPAPARQLFDSGCTWRLYEEEMGLRFDFYIAALGKLPYKSLRIDSQFSRATLQMSEEVSAGMAYSLSPLAYPLDELLIMHRLTQEKAIELHSCGIVRPDGTGNLFVGHSGAGKSTTTRLWTAREDVEVLSDDRIIVRRDESGCGVETPFRVAGGASEPGVLRLRDRPASPNGHSAQDDRARKDHFAQDDKKKCGMRMYGTPWHGEAAYASPGSAPLARIFIIEHGHGNVLTRLSSSQAVAELFARSFVPFHRHEYVDSALEFLQELVGAVPCYHYAFEPNEAAVERILEFRD
jgi:hypothetical protein